jgi:hypothetical protein
MENSFQTLVSCKGCNQVPSKYLLRQIPSIPKTIRQLHKRHQKFSVFFVPLAKEVAVAVHLSNNHKVEQKYINQANSYLQINISNQRFHVFTQGLRIKMLFRFNMALHNKSVRPITEPLKYLILISIYACSNIGLSGDSVEFELHTLHYKIDKHKTSTISIAFPNK